MAKKTVSRKRKPAEQPVKGAVERAAERAGIRMEDLPASFKTIPELGACVNDIQGLAGATLVALGVNMHHEPPSPEKVLEHAVLNELATLETLLVLTERAPEFGLDQKIGGLVERLLHDVYERLDLAACWSRTLSAVNASRGES